jgi:hypothetical protein
MSTAAPHIFPTLSRAKHSQLVSYPIGAEALSRALDGVPQHDMLACDFYAGNAHQHLDEPLQLALSVLYCKQARSPHHSQDAGDRGVFDPRWTINIFAIGRDVRHAIKLQLITEGLPKMVRPWLIDMAAVTGKTGEAGINLRYELATGVLVQTVGRALLPDRS